MVAVFASNVIKTPSEEIEVHKWCILFPGMTQVGQK